MCITCNMNAAYHWRDVAFLIMYFTLFLNYQRLCVHILYGTNVSEWTDQMYLVVSSKFNIQISGYGIEMFL